MISIAPHTRTLLLRWSAVGLVLPLALGSVSWLAFLAQLGYLSEAFAAPALFAAPLSPFVMKAFMAREVHGAGPYLIAAGVAIGNIAIYAALGALHAKLADVPQAKRLLWLTIATGLSFFVLDFIASVVAFA